MADKKDEIPAKFLDRRVAERYVKRGQLDEKDLAKHLKSLPDLADRADKVGTEFSTGDGLGPTR